MDKIFLQKLKGTLQAIINENKALRAQVDALNHSVNDVIIGGLKDAALEYEDNENFSNFYDTYNEQCSPYCEDYKTLFGDEADIIEDLYEGSKDKEDVGAYINEEISALQAKLDRLRAVKNDTIHEEAPSEEIVVEEGEEAPIDEEELMRIASMIK